VIPHVVVDVGNTRVKWGHCDPSRRRIDTVLSLPDEPDVWSVELNGWQAAGLIPKRDSCWVLSSVVPTRSERLAAWLKQQGQRVVRLEKASQLPLTVALAKPDHVGIDRLLDAVAAKAQLPQGQGAILVDAGSAVTVDWLDEEHRFCGGTIFPGLRLMTTSLHDYTALLPLIEIPDPLPALPGEDTRKAMQVGIFHALRGGIDRIIDRLVQQAKTNPALYITGGDARLLFASEAGRLLPGDLPAGIEPQLWQEQTLAGILASAETW